MKTKKTHITVTVFLVFCLLLLRIFVGRASTGTTCEGIDGNYYFECDGRDDKICHSITMNGETRVCHGKKTKQLRPFVNE